MAVEVEESSQADRNPPQQKPENPEQVLEQQIILDQVYLAPESNDQKGTSVPGKEPGTQGQQEKY